MAINIKNPETERLARELAALTGENMTAALNAAVCERLERVRREHDKDERLKRLTLIAEDIAGRLKEPFKSMDMGEYLYDEKGLPK